MLTEVTQVTGTASKPDQHHNTAVRFKGGPTKEVSGERTSRGGGVCC